MDAKQPAGSGPTVGLALIVRDEEKTLPSLLESIEGAFDQIVLVDTGSKDDTIGVFRRWVEAQDVAYTIDEFEWVYDFAAARNHADGLLTTDWKSWADADDVITNARVLRQLAQTAPPELVSYVFDYNYAQDPNTGACVQTLKRERLVRAGCSRWDGAVHEAQIVDGLSTLIDPQVCEWIHHSQEYAGNRNLTILKKWLQREPQNGRVLAYLGTEHASKGKHVRAIGYYKRYMKSDAAWDEERAQVYRKMCASLIALNRVDEAYEYAFQALRLVPSWPDTYLTLGECCAMMGEHQKAIEWASECQRRGQPQSLLIINPLDYVYGPRRVIAASLAAMGDYENAVRIGKEASELFPGDEYFQNALAGWRGLLKREHTADTFRMCAEQLMNHDEQLKALMLVEECIPHFAMDHPKIVQMRALLRARLAWTNDDEDFAEHYRTGGSKPEDFIPDDKIDEICNLLPRAGFLARGVQEQLQEAA